MKSISSKALIILALLFVQNSTQAQKIGNILKKASKGIEVGVTDILADKLTDKIVEVALKKIDARLDSILQDAYESDTTGTNSSATYADFLGNMDESDKVGEAYRFDLSTKMKVVDHKGNESYMTHYFSNDGKRFGMESESMFVVLDAEQKLMVTYNLEEKTAFAFGERLMKYSSHLIPDNMIPNYSIEASADTKSILGYNCKKYIGESSDGNYEVYVTNDFPISAQDAYGVIGETFMDKRFNESFEDVKGFALESIYTEENGQKTHSTAVNIDKTGFTINNSEFQFGAR